MPPPYQQLFDGQAAASGDNSVAMPLEVWQQAFMQDAPADVQALVHSLLVPHPMQYFRESVESFDAAAAGVEVQYVLAADDIALPPGEYGWDRFAQRLGVEPVSVGGSHEAAFTNPDGVAQALLG